MRIKQTPKSRGLILLVVLGMLALFSLLSITYVVFASHSRAASVAMARRENRGTPSPRLVDEAMRQLLRGTNDSQSALWGHSLLEDLYGSTPPAILTVRSVALMPNGNRPNLTPAVANDSQRPMILANRFLRIPLQLANPLLMVVNAGLPEVHWIDASPNPLASETDVYTGRVVTFRAGPLAHQSFRIVRYIGAIPIDPMSVNPLDFVRFAQQYSIIIDLTEADASKLVSFSGTTLTIEEWINRFPSGGSTLQSGVYLCHSTVGGTLTGGHSLLMNDVALNGHGAGMLGTGSPQTHTFSYPPNRTPPPTALLTMGVQLQPRFGSLGPTIPAGNADESYDAADYNDFYLALRASGATIPAGIIPSFHRAALINYIANWKDPATYTAAEFVWTLERIVRAAGRPLSINVTNLGNQAPAMPGDLQSFVMNPNFTGSNAGDYVSGAQHFPQLVLNLGNNWTNNWPGAVGSGPKDQYLGWLRWLTAGPWDVDNDGDGLNDSVWVDLDLPLMTSPEGKLLRMMAAYYVEDLDGKLDLNAVGNLTQPDNVTPPYSYTGITDNRFAAGLNLHLPQGFGYGPAESSLRHLFGDDTPVNDVAYRAFMNARYSSNNPTDSQPGGVGDDSISQLAMREKRPDFVHGQLPALPVAIRGRIALGLDRLGNPLLLNSGSLVSLNQSSNDPYESRWRDSNYQDSPFDLGEWERLLRFNDWDRTNLPRRLASFLPNPLLPAVLHSITPKSAHLRAPLFGSRTTNANDSVSSFFELVNVVWARRGIPNRITTPPNAIPGLLFAEFEKFFPLEFHRSERLNLNRAFGNGFDDDNDGQIDEPEELAKIPMQMSLSPNSLTTVAYSGIPEDYLLGQSNFDPLPMNAQMQALYGGLESRQLLARHLYCLAQLLIPNDYKFPNFPDMIVPTAKERAKLLAQWAVNVVDFRDADAAMTRFPYDETPFAQKTKMVGSPLTPQQYFAWEPDDGIVWGMEQPELLLTESLATHDTRVKEDTSMPGQVNQHRIPQGTLLLELYCPRTTSNGTDSAVPGVPSSLYGNNAGTSGVELGKLSPPDINNVTFPVWRIYIGDSKPKVPTANDVDPPNSPPPPLDRPSLAYRNSTERHKFSYQFPDDPMDLNSSSLGPNPPWNFTNAPAQAGFKFDANTPPQMPPPDEKRARVVLFTPANTFTVTDQNTPNVKTPARDHVFLNRTGNLFLSGGQYLIVGPRRETYFGSRKQSAVPPLHQPNTHRIELANTWAQIFKVDTSGNLQPWVAQRGTMRDCVTMIAAAAAPTTWGASSLPLPDVNRLIGINVSEPLPAASGYYQMPTARLNGDTAMANMIADVPTNAPGFSLLPPDAYHDFNTSPSPPAKPPFDDITMRPNNPFVNEDLGIVNWDLGMSGTTLRQGTQEDWCTAFLQRLADPEKPYHAAFNPYITIDWLPIDLTVFNGEDDPPSPAPSFQFASRQKTGVLLNSTTPNLELPNLVNPAPTERTFFSYHTNKLPPNSVPNPALTSVYFGRQLSVDEVTPGTPPVYSLDRALAKPDGTNSVCTLGFLNYTFELSGEPTGSFVAGFQGAPKHVPASLFWANRQYVNPLELTWVPVSAPGQFMQEFTAGNSTNPYAGPRNGFAHLLNYYSNPTVSGGVVDYPASTLLELVETTSPWSDTDSFVPPDDVRPLAPTTDVQFATQEAMATFRAPFNRVPGYVEPGRINLNTYSEASVFRGVMWNAITPANVRNAATPPPYFPEVSLSRQGFAPQTGFILNGNPNLHPDYPTQFAGVFKSPFEAGMVPATRNNVLDAVSSLNPTHTTLLRGTPMTTTPLFAPSAAVPWQPHALTQFLPFTRMSNLVTQKSNVFAVRITVGFFEYDPVTGLGLEYGSEQGRLRRHRGFFVIDRTAPVGFQVGQDLNTDKCISLRRIIE